MVGAEGDPELEKESSKGTKQVRDLKEGEDGQL